MATRRRSACLVTGAVVAFALGTGVAHADSAKPQMTGAVSQGDHVNAISAHGTGADAKGEFTSSGLFHGDVTCLYVTGNHAVATAVIDHSSDPVNPVGEYIVIDGVDAGNPSDGTSPDLFRVSFESNGFVYGSGDCRSPILPPAPVDSGDIVVQG